jgi:methionyl-tRNA synthetase
MSKSLGTAVDPLEAADRFGPDPLRLFLVREFAFGEDGDFSWERFEERYNSDLANNLGNLVSRVTAMAARYQAGVLRNPGARHGPLAGIADAALSSYREAMDAYRLQDGAAAAYRLVDATNEFIASTEPWAISRDAKQADRLNQVLYEAAEAIRIAAVLLMPVIPRSSREILQRIGDASHAAPYRLDRDGVWGAFGDFSTSQGDPLWPRLDTKKPA